MSASLPCLTGVPREVLEKIVNYADQPTLWRMMGACRRLRSAAIPVLHPMLVEQKITPDQPFMVDRYNAIGAIDDEDDMRERLVETCNASDRFHQLTAVYPPAARLLSRLVVEIRDDDAFAGWSQLQRYGPQLRTLEINIIDRFWHRMTGYPDRTAETSAAYRVLEQNMRSWKRVTDGGAARFENLTSLTIMGSARCMEHFAFLAESVPNLTELTVGIFWTDKDIYPEPCPMGLRWLRHPKGLKSLTAIGGTEHVLKILTPGLKAKFLTINLLDFGVPPMPAWVDGPDDFHILLLAKVIRRTSLSGLALVGERVGELLWMIRDNADLIWKSPGGEVELGQLESLMLEVMDAGLEGLAAHSILDNLLCLELSFIKRIIWVDRRTTEDGSLVLGLSDPTKDLAVDQLFELYPTLELVMWTPEYPSDPFAADDPFTWPERNIRACVYRDLGDDEASPLRVYLSTSE